MLRHTVMEWTREWERNGRVSLLMRLLVSKFGPLRPEDQARVEVADSETLLQWGERVLTARSMNEVFGS